MGEYKIKNFSFFFGFFYMLINIDVNRLDFTSSIFLIDNHFGSDRVCVCFSFSYWQQYISSFFFIPLEIDYIQLKDRLIVLFLLLLFYSACRKKKSASLRQHDMQCLDE